MNPKVEQVLREIDGCQFDNEREKRLFTRQRLVEMAVEAADEIILDGSDGSNEETNYLTGKVAEAFVRKTVIPYGQELLKIDLEVVRRQQT